jgi:hypothetical protein
VKRFAFPFAVVVVIACGSDPPGQSVGVNDVRKACDIRTAWMRRSSTSCTDCIALASAPKCDCPALQRPYSGACSTHRDAKLAEPSCDGVDGCVNNCPANDCNCVEGCYAGRDACRPRGAALDGCLAEMCDSECR